MSRSGSGNWAERIARVSISLLVVFVALQYIASGKCFPVEFKPFTPILCGVELCSEYSHGGKGEERH